MENKMEQKQEHKITMYWDYRDTLSEEQILKIIKEEDGLIDVENDIYENNIEYIDELRNEYWKEKGITDLQEIENLQDDLVIDTNINGLLKNSRIRLRVALYTNEDMITTNEGLKSDTINLFRKRFKGKFSLEQLKKELLNNCGSDYANLTFFFELRGKNILAFREQYQKGEITLSKGSNFGLFNSVLGCGSVLECQLKGNITLVLGDWRAKNHEQFKRESVLRGIENGRSESYYSVGVCSDTKKYGIQETYGLSSEDWREW